jgi:hypothetical protein
MFKRGLAVLAVGGAMTLVGTTPALAAGTFYYTGNTWGRAGWNPTTNQLRVEDLACDGYAVYASYDWGGRSDTPVKLWDHNCYKTDGPITVTLNTPAGVGSINIRICKWLKTQPDPCPNSESVIVTH